MDSTTSRFVIACRGFVVDVTRIGHMSPGMVSVSEETRGIVAGRFKAWGATGAIDCAERIFACDGLWMMSKTSAGWPGEHAMVRWILRRDCEESEVAEEPGDGRSRKWTWDEDEDVVDDRRSREGIGGGLLLPLLLCPDTMVGVMRPVSMG